MGAADSLRGLPALRGHALLALCRYPFYGDAVVVERPSGAMHGEGLSIDVQLRQVVYPTHRHTLSEFKLYALMILK